MVKGQFIFQKSKIAVSNVPDKEQTTLLTAIQKLWDSYLKQDAKGYVGQLAPDVLRLSQRAGKVQQGREAVKAGLPAEWEALERPEGIVAEEMTVIRAEFNQQPAYISALYWIEIVGGGRWDYTDLGVVFQVFMLTDKGWKIAHHLDSWELNYDVAKQKPGGWEAMDFDFVHPVKNLSRAVNFYTPILGQPESVTPKRAVFNFKGARFILDPADWGEKALVERGLPNGYAIFYVDDLAKGMTRYGKGGAKWQGEVQKMGLDQFVIGLDPAKNLFMVWEKKFGTEEEVEIPLPAGFNREQPFLRFSYAIAQAWLGRDTKTLASYYGSDGFWFDDTRLKQRGLEKGAGIIKALQEVYWPLYDQTSKGIATKMEISNARVRPLGEGALVSYEMVLTGLGSHPFRDRAYVTHLFTGPRTVAYTFVCANNHNEAMAVELDYTGYPTTDLNKVKKFYGQTMELGEGYPDESYHGYWMNKAVFGLYISDPDEDGLPRPGQSNGYVSFWVRSADKIYAYLKQQGCSFPVIPALNDKSGIDSQPGYRQVIATDSEGNLVIFTEYSGRLK